MYARYWSRAHSGVCHDEKAIEMTPTQHGESTEVRSLAGGRPAQIEALIHLRAYELYLARGREPGRELDDWLRAEMEVVRQRINTLAM